MGIFDSFKKNKKSVWEKLVEKYKPGKELVKPSDHIIAPEWMSRFLILLKNTVSVTTETVL